MTFEKIHCSVLHPSFIFMVKTINLIIFIPKKKNLVMNCKNIYSLISLWHLFVFMENFYLIDRPIYDRLVKH